MSRCATIIHNHFTAICLTRMSSIRAARHAMCHSMPRRLHQLSTKGDLSLSLSLSPSLSLFSHSFPPSLPFTLFSFPSSFASLSISLLFSLRAHFSLSLFLCRYINLLMPCFIFTRAHEYSDTSLYFFALFFAASRFCMHPLRNIICIEGLVFFLYLFFSATPRTM